MIVLLSTGAETLGSNSEQSTKNKVYLASQEKLNQSLEGSAKQISINGAAAEQIRVGKEKATAIEAQKSKQDELDKQAEAAKVVEAAKLKQVAADKAKKIESDKVVKAAADKVKKDEADRLAKIEADKAKIAADKAKQEEIDRIATQRADKAKQAKIAEDIRLQKVAFDKAEADKLAKVEADKVAKAEAANPSKTEADKLAKAEAAKKEAARLAALALQQTTIGGKLFAYLSPEANVTSVVNAATILNGGNPSNTCVYFSSETMRRIGVAVPRETCNTQQYLGYLGSQGWVANREIKNLTPGSICFTTPDNYRGYPTHTFVFMGWASSDYSSALVADNQDNKVHVRSMRATDATDAFAFFMHN